MEIFSDFEQTNCGNKSKKMAIEKTNQKNNSKSASRNKNTQKHPKKYDLFMNNCC